MPTMRVSGVVALIAVFPHGALASGTCSSGYMEAKGTCSTSIANAASCNSRCCDLDDTKCAKYASSVTCAIGKYFDPASAATATAAGGANKNTDCCTAKAACSTGTCSTGYKKKSTLTNLVCTSSATTAVSCNNDCCELDTTKCLAHASSIICAAGKYFDATASAGTATTTDKNTACCTDKAACSAGTCSAGYKKKSTLTNLFCTSSATTAASCNNDCCELDDTKCANYYTSLSCATGKYIDTTTVAGTPTAAGGANKNTDCCTAKATCSAGTCAAGYKKKSTLTNLYCTSSATTAASCNTDCCELDDTKCENYYSTVSCATGKYKDLATVAGTATAAGGANKNTDCCIAKATCSAGTCAAGYKKKSTLTNLYCTSSATTAASCNNDCCDIDNTKCLYYQSSISCAAGKYWDATASAGTATAAGGLNKNTDCCTAKTLCSAFFPAPAGSGGGVNGTGSGSGGKGSTSDVSPTAPALAFIVLSSAVVLMTV